MRPVLKLIPQTRLGQAAMSATAVEAVPAENAAPAAKGNAQLLVKRLMVIIRFTFLALNRWRANDMARS